MWANIVVSNNNNNDDDDENDASHRAKEQLTERERAEREKIENKRRQNDVVKFRYEVCSKMSGCGIKTVDIKLDGAQVRKIWIG